MIRSASFTRNSPEMSLVNKESRRSARRVDSLMFIMILFKNGSVILLKALISLEGGDMT
jgi:hypothetical protein